MEAVPAIAPGPLLIVHGDRDFCFPLDHPRTPAEAAGGPGELRLEPGMGHTGHAAGDGLPARIGDRAVGRGG